MSATRQLMYSNLKRIAGAFILLPGAMIIAYLAYPEEKPSFEYLRDNYPILAGYIVWLMFITYLNMLLWGLLSLWQIGRIKVLFCRAYNHNPSDTISKLLEENIDSATILGKAATSRYENVATFDLIPGDDQNRRTLFRNNVFVMLNRWGRVDGIRPKSELLPYRYFAPELETISSDDKNWKNLVQQVLESADICIVEISRRSENVAWEISTSLKLLGENRVILIDTRTNADKVENDDFPESLTVISCPLDAETKMEDALNELYWKVEAILGKPNLLGKIQVVTSISKASAQRIFFRTIKLFWFALIAELLF